jgi:ABC-type transport system substrate-binding protein
MSTDGSRVGTGSHGKSGARDLTVSRRRFLAGSAIAGALPGLVGAGFSIRPARAASTGTLIVGMKEGALRTLDPNGENEYSCFIIIKNLYDTLVTFSGPSLQTLEPSLAAKWAVSGDGLSYTFDLDPHDASFRTARR